MNNVKYATPIICIVTCACLAGCRKFIETGPPSHQIESGFVFSNDATAQSVVRGIYIQMASSAGFAQGGGSSIHYFAGLSSDELLEFTGNEELQQFSRNNLLPNNPNIKGALWESPYKLISNANAVIQGLENSSAVTASMKNQLTGEAEFIRAFCYFYLVNMFGNVPLVLTTDYRINKLAAAKSTGEVYDQIITDLTHARELLAKEYSFSNGEKNQPNSYAAAALLARVYLYNQDWQKAEEHASDVINNGEYQLCSSLNDVFLKNSTEAIWQIQPVLPGLNTNEGAFFKIMTTPPVNTALNHSLVNNFESTDVRKIHWIDSITDGTSTYYYPCKYKIWEPGLPLEEYSMVLRLAEQYLIRAEARAQLNDIDGSLSDLNTIHQRAGLPALSLTTRDNLRSAIQLERTLELFTEWGHRWLDVKRWQLADQLFQPLKGADWQPTDVLYPIPQSEIENDPNLKQNPGY